jgi:ABC-type lipoprotein release transport system permease subunit
LAAFMSLGINHFFSIHGIDYPQAVEMGGFVITTMYGSTIPKVFVYPALVTLFTAILVSIPPAVRAMRITPMKAIRTV